MKAAAVWIARWKGANTLSVGKERALVLIWRTIAISIGGNAVIFSRGADPWGERSDRPVNR